MTRAVGIDDLNVYAGPWAIGMDEIAAKRGHSEKMLRDAGFRRRSVVPPFEDPLTLAVNAARPLVQDAGPASFGLLLVATESSSDFGKPLSSYAHRHLGLGERCRNFEIKHACYGGTAALQAACAWVRSGEAAGRNALVLMTDVARRHFGDAAELTAGAGAVAMTVREEPRVAAIEPTSGTASLEVYDVARPTQTFEWGDPLLSLNAYLDLLDMAWEAYCAAGGAPDPQAAFGYQIYHTPLVGLARRAHRALTEATREEVDEGAFEVDFEERVLPCLDYNREVANIYSGSVYASLAGLIDRAAPPPGERVGIFSYGSGSCAEFLVAVVAPGAGARLARHRIGDALARRSDVDLETYEQCVAAQERMHTEPDYEPALAIPGSHRERELLALERVQGHQRHYRR